jgi:hypothetical protein
MTLVEVTHCHSNLLIPNSLSVFRFIVFLFFWFSSSPGPKGRGYFFEKTFGTLTFVVVVFADILSVLHHFSVVLYSGLNTVSTLYREIITTHP